MTSMPPADLDQFLRETRIAKLAYLQESGAPTMIPIWFEWDGEVARMFTSRTSRKAKRIAAEPRVALCVEEAVGVPERWATIEGDCSISDDGTVALIERLTHRYYEPAKAEETLRSWLAKPEMWVTLTIQPNRVRSSG